MALVVAVDVVFRDPTFACAIALWAIAKASPLTEIKKAIWNVDKVTTPCQRQVIQLTVSTLSILIVEEVREAQALWKDPLPNK